MRLWWLHPKYLCQQRLVGQHREVHMLLGAMKKNQMQSHPLTKFMNRYGWNTAVLYHNLIVKEMETRDLHGHKTPVDWDEGYPIHLPDITDEMIKQDILDLLERWSRYGQRGKPRVELPDRATKVGTIFALAEFMCRYPTYEENSQSLSCMR